MMFYEYRIKLPGDLEDQKSEIYHGITFANSLGEAADKVPRRFVITKKKFILLR